MNKATCKFHNGDYFNTHCEAGVCYRDVTTDPDRVEGRAFRKPCIDWMAWNAERGTNWDNEKQRENWALRGHCDKRQFPTAEEVAEFEVQCDAKFREHMENIKNDICPTHKISITKKQVGHCVYADPCGCRLYQGKLVKKEKNNVI